MKKPKLIFTYTQRDNSSCKIREYHLEIYQPSEYNQEPKYWFSFATKLFSIRGQANTEQPDDSANTWNRKGLHHAYALRIEDLELGYPESFTLATKLCKDLGAADSFPAIVKRLRKAGAVRYAIGNVTSKSGAFDREFMPRKYSKTKSTAYWNAITSGLDVAA